MRNKTKIIAVIAIIIAALGIGIGFAAFSSTLTISSSATVTPSADTFKVVFGNSDMSAPTSGTTTVIQNITFDFSGKYATPGKSRTKTYYVYNIGEYVAYLNSVTFANATPTCTPGEGTTPSLVEAACEGISLSISVVAPDLSFDTQTYTQTTTDISGIALNKAEPGGTGQPHHNVQVKVTYAANSARADGPFSVSFGDVTLNYGSAD